MARFVCDPLQHQVHRLDAAGRILDSFGEPGRAHGEFDTPSDSAVVLPMFEEEDIAGCSRAALVAVADRMNHRVQVFELEGQFVTALGEFSETGANADRPGREGWPYFRLTPHPVLNEPVRLRWEAPFLHIVDAQGQHDAGRSRVFDAAGLRDVAGERDGADAGVRASSLPVLRASHARRWPNR